MAINDFGSNQSITFDFKQDATSINFNTYNRGLIKPGLYKGGKVIFNQNTGGSGTTYTYTIEPFVCAFAVTDSGSDLLVNIGSKDNMTIISAPPSTEGNINFGIPQLNGNIYLVFSFSWVKTLNNYITPKFISDISSLGSNEIIICRLRGNGSLKPSIYYDTTTYGSYYEGFDNNFTIDGTNALDNPTNQESDVGRQLVPYSSNAYTLNLTGINTTYSKIKLPPLNGEIELTDLSDLSQKVKIIITLKDSNTVSEIDNNFHISYSSKMPISINSSDSVVADHLNFFVNSKGRLKISNGFDELKKYKVVFNLHSGIQVNRSLS